MTARTEYGRHPKTYECMDAIRNTSMDTAITQMAHYSHLSLQIAQV